MNKRTLNIMIIAAVVFALLFFLLRGPYLSNSIKRVIVPVLENTTRERVLIDKAVINLFPFYIQAKGLKVFDKDGNRLLWVTKTRVYLDLFSLLVKDIRIRKLTVSEPDINADEEDLKRIWGNLRGGAGGGEQKHGISINNVELTDGIFQLKNARGDTVSGSGFFFELTTKNDVTAQVIVKEASVKTVDQPRIKGSFRGRFSSRDDRIRIAELNVIASKNSIAGKGEIVMDGEGGIKEGTFTGSTKLHDEVFRRIFGLKTDKEGVLSFNGTVRMSVDSETKKPLFALDLRTDSEFYLETLMELVHADNGVSGKLSVKGKIQGTFPDLMGSGTARLEKAELGHLSLDSVEGKVEYANRVFTLNDFVAETYDGKMNGKASLALAHGDYTVDAGIEHVSSPEFFRFIGWEPPFPDGEVAGHFLLTHVHDRDIEVTADASYRNTSEKSGNIVDRMSEMKASLHLKDGVLDLSRAVLSTQDSRLLIGGTIDLKRSTVGLSLDFDTQDMSDLAAPYYGRLSFPARFTGTMKGPLHDPEIAGKIEGGPGSIHGLGFSNASADLSYRIKSLTVSRLNITEGKATYDAEGVIEFRGAEGLFSFSGPFYRGKGTVREAALGPFIKALYGDIPADAEISGAVTFEGNPEKFISKGDLVAHDAVIYGQKIESAAVKAEIRPDHLEFTSVSLQRGESKVDGSGKVFFDNRFSLSLSSSKMRLSDIDLFHGLPFGGNFTLDIDGAGTFSKPEIKFSVLMTDSMFRKVKTGKGEIRGSLKGKELTAEGTLMNGLIKAVAKASLSGNNPWNVDADIRKGSYEFLVSDLFRDPQEDLDLSLSGKTVIRGEGKNVHMISRFDYVSCSLYGYNLRNDEDVVIGLEDREFTIQSFSLSGDNANITAGGSLRPNDRFDVRFKGGIKAGPLKTLSTKIASLRGEGEFTAAITGPWDLPDVTGEIAVRDTVLSMTEYPYKVGPLNGTIFLKKDRFTFDSVRTNFGGGSIDVSGVGYLRGLELKRISISTAFEGISIRPMEKVSALVDGRLMYERSEKGSTLSGNVDIKKARYEKDVEWNKWLINLREMNTEAVRYPAFLKDTYLTINISGDENIVIDNNLAKTPVKISVTLTGTAGRFGLVGKAEASEGTVYFRGNDFKILEGSNVDFVDSSKVTPLFHIRAETYTGEYYIQMNLNGTIDKFTLSLFSDPPLTEMEILNLLTFGQTMKDSRGIESGIAASEAASVLTGGLQDIMQEDVKNITGFERFRIEPYTTSTGAVNPKVTIGKRLFEDKLFVIYSTSVGTTEENIIKLEYKLDRNISLIGSKDELNSIGGDIKFRFEFK